MRRRTLATALMGTLVAGSCAATHNMTGTAKESAMENKANDEQDRAAIIETVESVARGADRRQWQMVQAAFAGRVVLDYGTPDLLTPEEIVARWRPLLSAFDNTQHVIRDVQVTFQEPERARVSSRFQATHHLDGVAGGAIWILEGRYEHELVKTPAGWRISRMRMIPDRSTGNPALAAAARARAHLPEPAQPTVTADRVSFTSDGDEIVGILRQPAARRPGEPLSAVVVLGSWTTVKEQMPALYAERLAAAGFAALTIDFRGFGESGGFPRGFESPRRKIADIRAAVSFLTAREGVDPTRLGLVGVCASSGYVAAEAADDPRVKSVVLIAPWLHDASLVELVYGSREAYGEKGVAALTAAGTKARERFDRDGTVDYVPAASSTDTRAAMYDADPKVLDYYLNVRRGGIPQWGNRFAVQSWPEWLNFDALASAPRLRAPTLIVHSEQGAIPDGARRFARAMPNPPKMVWMPGTQFDFYDDAATIDRATGTAVEHLRQTLAAGDVTPATQFTRPGPR